MGMFEHLRSAYYFDKTMTQMPNNYDDTLDYCEKILKTIFEEALTLEESTEYKLKEVQVIVAHLTNIEKMKYTWRSSR
jgi:hypothetical protein